MLSKSLEAGNSEILKRMAGRIKEFVGDWDALWNNIQLRAKCKQAIVDQSLENNDPSFLEFDSVIKANDQFHIISDEVIAKTGKLDSDRILFEYKEWLKKEIKKRNI